MQSLLNLQSTVKRSQDKLSCEMSGEIVVLDMKSGMYYGINSVGAAIWNLIEQPRTIESIRDAISSEYKVTSEDCVRDVTAFLEEMKSAGLIEITNEVHP